VNQTSSSIGLQMNTKHNNQDLNTHNVEFAFIVCTHTSASRHHSETGNSRPLVTVITFMTTYGFVHHENFQFYYGQSTSREGAVSEGRCDAGIAGSCGCCKVSAILEGPRVQELSLVSNVASLFGKFGCKSEVICGGVKEISGTEPWVNNLESGVITRSIWDVGEADLEDIRGSTGSMSSETGTGEDDDGMSGTIEGESTSNSVRLTALDGSNDVEATKADRVSDSELSTMGEITGASG
jgi:hypothetical protein